MTTTKKKNEVNSDAVAVEFSGRTKVAIVRILHGDGTWGGYEITELENPHAMRGSRREGARYQVSIERTLQDAIAAVRAANPGTRVLRVR